MTTLITFDHLDLAGNQEGDPMRVLLDEARAYIQALGIRGVSGSRVRQIVRDYLLTAEVPTARDLRAYMQKRGDLIICRPKPRATANGGLRVS